MLSTMFFRRAQGIIVVYDITERDSLARAKEIVEQVVKAREVATATDVPFAVAANKIDLDVRRQVPITDGQAFARSIGAEFYEVCAKEGTDVEAPFVSAVRAVIAHAQKDKDKCLIM